MTTYLLVWNPKRWDWTDLADNIRAVATDDEVIVHWSCGRAKNLQVGDRAFLIRLGVEPKGIMGAGTIIRERHELPHYDPARAARGDLLGRVEVRFDTLLNPLLDPLLPREFLHTAAPFSAMHWDTQMSGVRIPDHIAIEVEREWAKLTDGTLLPLAEEVSEALMLHEGATKQIMINAYERNAEARKQCLAHHGTRCTVYDFDFAATYGPVGAGFIHVHHLRPLATIGAAYAVDPIADLRPICPNCHAIIHHHNPPYTIEQVRRFLHEAKLS